MSETIGFIGLGGMGQAMARNLQQLLKDTDGQDLRIYNRTASKSDAFASSSNLPCQVMPSPAKLAAECSIICMMLTDDKACDSTLQQLCSAGLQGKLVINHSTNSPAFAKTAVGQVANAGGVYISAPVWGRPDVAAAARLVVGPAGPQEAVQRAQPFLAAHGRVLPAQDEPSKSNIMKLAGNFMLFAFCEVISEGLTLADKNGISREAMLALLDAFFPAPVIQRYSRIIADEAFDNSDATVDLALEVVHYIRGLAESSKCPLPTADIFMNNLLTASANGDGSKDALAIFHVIQQAAGLKNDSQKLKN